MGDRDRGRGQIFISHWLELGISGSNMAQTGRKRGSHDSRVVLHSFYVLILSINFICSPNLKV